MKKIMYTMLMLFVLLSVNSFAVTGSISYSSGIFATEDWADAATTLMWDVTESGGIWTYDYTFSVSNKDISHLILEVSDNFTGSNILDISSGWDFENAPMLYPSNPAGTPGSNPGMPGDLYGIKWDTGVNTTSYNFWIVTDRAPMWGNFYAKNGVSSGNDVYAYNSMFDDYADGLVSRPDYDPNAQAPDGWALVPDTQTSGVIPEPGTFLLLGSGLLGMALYRRKRK